MINFFIYYYYYYYYYTNPKIRVRSHDTIFKYILSLIRIICQDIYHDLCKSLLKLL